MRSRSVLEAGLGVLAALAIAGVSGCGSRVIDLREPPEPDPLPAAASPEAALLRLQWAWNHRDREPLRDLYTSDFRYAAAAPDTGGTFELFRQSELAFATSLFVTGTATRPPARTIAFELTRPLVAGPSPVPGQDPRWHREISTVVHVGVRVPDGDYRVTGLARFGLVRGDSARIPQELLDRGVLPDSSQWWIERWEEDGSGGSAARAMPSAMFTLSTLKAIYLDLPPPAQPR